MNQNPSEQSPTDLNPTDQNPTDLNFVVISGRLAAPVDLRVFDSGSQLVRLLLTVRSEKPRRRVDVIPITVWNPTQWLIDDEPRPGERLSVAGGLQRRFWDGPNGRRSRVELVAEQVTRRPADLDLAV